MKNQLMTSNESIFSTERMNQIISFANLMADGTAMLPKHLHNKPADCMAVALQAASWGMSPFAVAQKTHLVNGTLGYEAQLINAVISSSNAITGRFHYKTIGDWSKWKYQNLARGGDKEKHGGMNEDGLGVQVGAILAGESEITWDDPVYIAPVYIRNSPLWKSRPLQQLRYLAVKYWARLYVPEVILGVYSPDELTNDPAVERDITPETHATTSEKSSISDLMGGDPIEEAEVFTSEEQGNPEPVNSELTQEPTAYSMADMMGASEENTDSDLFDKFNAELNGVQNMEEYNGVAPRIKQAHDSGSLSNDEYAQLVGMCGTLYEAFKEEKGDGGQ